MTTFARLAMLLLKHGRGEGLPAHIAELHHLWSELRRAPEGRDAILLLRYAAYVARMTTEEVCDALAPASGEKESREMAMTLAEMLIGQAKSGARSWAGKRDGKRRCVRRRPGCSPEE